MLDGDGTAAQVLDADVRDSSNSYSQELNLNFDSGALRNIFGVSYFHERVVDLDGFHLYNVGLTLSAGPGSFQVDRAWGIFDQATYRITDHGRRALQ